MDKEYLRYKIEELEITSEGEYRVSWQSFCPGEVDDEYVPYGQAHGRSKSFSELLEGIIEVANWAEGVYEESIDNQGRE